MAKRNMTPLGAQYPDMAKWLVNPSDADLPCHSPKKVMWSCALGHEWSAPIRNRTQLGAGCLVCSGQRVQIGFNDAWTTDPGLCVQLKNAEDGYGCVAGSTKKVEWVCELGHEWVASFKHRSKGTRCPYCRNKSVKKGLNDLWTERPDVAEELDDAQVGYHFCSGSTKRTQWRCRHDPAHVWVATIVSRTTYDRGCPSCAHYGFDPLSDAAVLYLVEPPDGPLIFGKVQSPSRLEQSMLSDYRDCRIVASTVPSSAALVSAAERQIRQLPGRPIGTRKRAITESMERSGRSIEIWVEIASRHGLALA